MSDSLPLTYAVFKLCSVSGEMCVADVMKALEAEYGQHKQFAPDKLEEVLMTGVANGVLDETRYDVDDEGKLRNYYQVNEYGRKMINDYIG